MTREDPRAVAAANVAKDTIGTIKRANHKNGTKNHDRGRETITDMMINLGIRDISTIEMIEIKEDRLNLKEMSMKEGNLHRKDDQGKRVIKRKILENSLFIDLLMRIGRKKRILKVDRIVGRVRNRRVKVHRPRDGKQEEVHSLREMIKWLKIVITEVIDHLKNLNFSAIR